MVDQPSKRFKLFFTADSTEGTPGIYPIESYLMFADGCNLKVVDESIKPQMGIGAQFGPFTSVAGKVVDQVNFEAGANKDPAGTRFNNRISVQAFN